MTRRRAAILQALAVTVLFQQSAYFANPDHDPLRTVDHFPLIVTAHLALAWFRFEMLERRSHCDV
ncbi:MAG: hypothetical protein NVS3B5_23110 [Sphingomicrobium sp.]